MPHGEPDISFVPQVFDHLAAVQPEVYREDPEARPEREVAAAVAEALVRLVEACGSDPLRLAIAVSRWGKMSYSQIAAVYGTTGNAVHKHLAAIAMVNPALSEYLIGLDSSVHQLTPIKDDQAKRVIPRKYRQTAALMRRHRRQRLSDDKLY